MLPPFFRFTTVAFLVLVVSPPLLARGADYAVNDDAKLVWMPPGLFADEVARLRPVDFHVPPAVRRPDNVSAFESSTAVDLEELGLALDDLKVGPERKADLIEQYAAVRKEIGRRMNQATRHPEYDIPYPVPAGIPEEFSDYLQALLWSHNGQMEDARVLWEKIAALPADSRRYRGPWAVFMLGRSWVETNPGKAIEFFHQTRQWIGDGPDRLGLASSSLGWEGRALLNQGHTSDAARLYLRQVWTGDPTAVESLQFCLTKLVSAEPETRREILADNGLRQAMTAFVFCDHGQYRDIPPDARRQFPGWLADIQAHGVADAGEADRLAWAVYCSDDVPTARALIARGNPESPLHRLLTAKLMLVDHDVDRAIPVLESLVPKPAGTWSPLEVLNGALADAAATEPENDRLVKTAASDLRALYLAKGRYTDVLTLQLVCNVGDQASVDDANYVIERILTADELRAFVDRLDQSGQSPGRAAVLRAQLAGRLWREGRTDPARKYFSPEQKMLIERYEAELAEGRDPAKAADVRYAALMSASKFCLAQEPVMFGSSWWPPRDAELGRMPEQGRPASSPKQPMTDPSADECARFAKSAKSQPKPHFERYDAADLAWEAAALFPDNSTQKLDALYTGGTWLKTIDPKAADRFYKAICKHCGATPLGKKCAAARWFADRSGT